MPPLILSDFTAEQIKMMDPETRKAAGKLAMGAAECRSAACDKAEKELQKDIRNLLSLRGLPFINPPMHRKSALPLGWPDFSIFLDNGATVFWEVKVGRNNLDPDQCKVRDSLLKRGHHWRLIRSLFECQEHLREIGGTRE
jgi:hypothetical protein